MGRDGETFPDLFLLLPSSHAHVRLVRRHLVLYLGDLLSLDHSLHFLRCQRLVLYQCMRELHVSLVSPSHPGRAINRSIKIRVPDEVHLAFALAMWSPGLLPREVCCRSHRSQLSLPHIRAAHNTHIPGDLRVDPLSRDRTHPVVRVVEHGSYPLREPPSLYGRVMVCQREREKRG